MRSAPFNDGPLPGVPTSAYYGYSNLDTQEIGLDAFTTIVDHGFSDGFSLRNLTRWQEVEQYSFVDQPQGTWCVETGVNPWTGAACAAPGTFVPNRGGTIRDTANEILVNQTDFTARVRDGQSAAHVGHGLLAVERDLSPRQRQRPAQSARGDAEPRSAADEHREPRPRLYGARQLHRHAAGGRRGRQQGGVRFRPRAADASGSRSTPGCVTRTTKRRARSANIAVPYPAPPAPPVVTPGPLAENTDELGSYRVGLVFKPSASSSIYLAQGNSETPSQASRERYVRRRDELQRRSRGSGDRRARRQVGASGRADVDGRGVPQRAQPVPRAFRRPDDPGAAARRQLARRRRRARRGWARSARRWSIFAQLHVPRQRGLAERIGSSAWAAARSTSWPATRCRTRPSTRRACGRRFKYPMRSRSATA